MHTTDYKIGGMSKRKVPCFIPMQVMLTVVCDCAVCYYVIPATRWQACSLVQREHPYQHYLKNGNHTEKMDKGRSVFHISWAKGIEPMRIHCEL